MKNPFDTIRSSRPEPQQLPSPLEAARRAAMTELQETIAQTVRTEMSRVKPPQAPTPTGPFFHFERRHDGSYLIHFQFITSDMATAFAALDAVRPVIEGLPHDDNG
jgi:hypothetical protein